MAQNRIPNQLITMGTESPLKQFHKILIQQESGLNDSLINETVWAEKVNDDEYVIDNIPFYAFLYSVGDLVKTQYSYNENVVKNLIRPSGNSTVRISGDVPSLREIRKLLLENSCDSEMSASAELLAVNIPKNVSYSKVIDLIVTQGDLLDLDYEEACISEHHSNSRG